MPTRTGKHAAPSSRGRSRAARRTASAPAGLSGGRHRHTTQRTTLVGLTPRAVGAAALVAATSAAAVQGGAFATAVPASSPAGSIAVQLPEAPGSAGDTTGDTAGDTVGGAGRTGTALFAARHLPTSRDSSRQALQESGAKLESPGGAEGKQENGDLKKLAASAEKVAGQIQKDAWQLPIPRGIYHLTARFGQCSGLWSHCHTGLDFAAPTGTPIHAVANGVITEVGWAGAYGNRTEMQLKDGTVLWYCHQNTIAAKVGEQVVGGQVIGYVGSTGNTTGPHLHLEVRPGGGDPVDPYQALSVRGVTP